MNALKYVVTFAGGFAVGAWFMFAKLSAKFEEELIAETESARDYYRDMYKKDMDESEEEMPLVSEKDKEEKEFADKVFKSINDKMKYSKMFAAGVDLAEREHPEEDKPEPIPPYIISQQDFINSGYEQITLMYYESIDVLAEDEDIVEDPKNVVGTIFKDHFGDEEIDVVYVRNEKLGTDYEIILDHSDPDSARAILGYEGESEE